MIYSKVRPTMDSIEAVRKKIDHLDEQIVQLIEQRADLVNSLIKLKQEQGVAVRVPEREREVVTQLHQRHGDHFTLEELQSIYQPIFDACVRIQLTDWYT